MKELVIKRKIEDEAIVISEERLISVGGHSSFVVDEGGSGIVVRVTGSLKYKAFRLNDALDWEIGIDEEGAKCLVPLKKQEDC